MRVAKAVLPTVSGLRPYQASILAEKYLEVGSWSEVKTYANEENIFEASRKATSNRYAHHLVKILSSLDCNPLDRNPRNPNPCNPLDRNPRNPNPCNPLNSNPLNSNPLAPNTLTLNPLATNPLNHNQIEVVAHGSDKDKRAMLWLGFCLAYPIVGGFATEVVSEKYRNHNLTLKAQDLWEYLANKSVEYENLQDISDAVRSKAKCVIFYNLRDAELLNSLDEIQPAYLSGQIKEMIPSCYWGFFPGEEA